MAKRVDGPNWDKTRERWVVRWTSAAGKRRTRSVWLRSEREGADDFATAKARELLGLESSKAAAGSAASDDAPPVIDGSSASWQAGAAWSANRVLKAQLSGDVMAIEREGKACRAFSALSSAAVPHANIEELEIGVEFLEQRLKQIESEVEIGTGVGSARTDAVPEEESGPERHPN